MPADCPPPAGRLERVRTSATYASAPTVTGRTSTWMTVPSSEVLDRVFCWLALRRYVANAPSLLRPTRCRAVLPDGSAGDTGDET